MSMRSIAYQYRDETSVMETCTDLGQVLSFVNRHVDPLQSRIGIERMVLFLAVCVDGADCHPISSY